MTELLTATAGARCALTVAATDAEAILTRAGSRMSRFAEEPVWHQLRAFREEAMSGDYDNVLWTAMRGAAVT
jgi:ABC-type Fe3+-citrate transport system substrate-binding protein